MNPSVMADSSTEAVVAGKSATVSERKEVSVNSDADWT